MTRQSENPSTRLTKSRILSGLQCEKRLWLETYRPDLKPEPTAAQERVVALGSGVGELARTHFPGGSLVEAPIYDLAGSARETAALIDRPEVPHIYEAAFSADDVHVKVDVLSRLDDESWHLIEVKSSSSVKEQHLIDATIQRHVAEAAGLSVTHTTIMHLNRECRHPDLTDLFAREEISERSREIRSEIPAIISRMKSVVSHTSEPSVPVGTHCMRPYECPFKSYCWQQIPRHSIFTIPRLSGEKKDSLSAQGKVRLVDVPTGELDAAQAAHVEMVLRGEPVIDVSAVHAAIDFLEYPLYFLDFETCTDAVPRLNGLGPWQGYPFQYSLHVLDGSGKLTHSEYLHEDETDPRPALAASLCANVGTTGTIVAYNARFERVVIENLAGAVPHVADQLRAMLPRFFDLLLIFQSHFSHPDFLGSNSIKSVLPVLVPDLSYKGMAVADGNEAQAVWASTIMLPPGDEKKRVLNQLLAYCRLDTMAMVKILDLLRLQ